MKEEYGDRLAVQWNPFPLEQVNNVHGGDWKLWEQPDDYRSKGLWAFRAAEAARLQGPGAFDRLHMALLHANHRDNENIADRAFLVDLAEREGLDVSAFQRDLGDRSLLAKIGESYARGVRDHGIWGTPTLVFEDGRSAYLKIRPAPADGEATKLFEDLVELIRDRPYVIEVKRPR